MAQPWPGCGWLHSNCCRATPGAVQWPRVRGEVGDLVQALERLARQGSQHAEQQSTLGSQFQAILDHASVGIVITRHGVLEVVGRQTCLMLGYTLPNCKASRAHHLRLFRRICPRWRQGAGRVCGARRV